MTLSEAREQFSEPPGPGTPKRPWPAPGQMWVDERSGIQLRVRAVRGDIVLCGYVNGSDNMKHTTTVKEFMKKRFIPADRELEFRLNSRLGER